MMSQLLTEAWTSVSRREPRYAAKSDASFKALTHSQLCLKHMEAPSPMHFISALARCTMLASHSGLDSLSLREASP